MGKNSSYKPKNKGEQRAQQPPEGVSPQKKACKKTGTVRNPQVTLADAKAQINAAGKQSNNKKTVRQRPQAAGKRGEKVVKNTQTASQQTGG